MVRHLVVAAVVAATLFGASPAVKAAPPPSREVFVYPGGEFVHVDASEWVLKRKDGLTVRCITQFVSPAYVEILDTRENVRVRLYNDRGEIDNRQTGRWEKWTDGFWKQ